MSITDTFDESKPVFTPENQYPEGHIADKCIVTFSYRVLDDVLERYECETELSIRMSNGPRDVYSLKYRGEKILFYLSPIGAPGAGSFMDEVRHAAGVKKFIVFGSCGSLDSEKTNGKLIVPTESYRDEGFSYHYMKASDYIAISNSSRLEEIFKELSLPYICGRSWTTDAIYRETANNVKKRREEGCICVEMESSGLQSLCTFEKIDLYTFFFASDLVGGEVWENMNLGTDEEKKHQVSCFETALKIAERM